MTRADLRRERLLVELGERFIDMLRRARALESRGLEQAFRSVPRHYFVDRYYDERNGKRRLVNIDPRRPTPAQLERIYRDTPLLSHRDPSPSSTSQPSLVAQMLGELDLRPGMRVLEIGAGTGWNAALMGHLVGGDGHVHSVDIDPDAARRARRHIRRLGFENVSVVTADGFKGCRTGAPYDRIITTVACPDVFPAWSEQLTPGGVLLVTLQDIPGTGACLLARLTKRKGHLRGAVVGLPWFMVLLGAHGYPVANSSESADQAKEGGRRITRLAPWISWPPGGNVWRLRDLLFLAYLEGMRVKQVGREFVLSCPESGSICVTAEGYVKVLEGEDAYEALELASKRWLELGAPKRSDYRVEVWSKQHSKRRPKNGWLVQRDHSQLIFRLKRDRSYSEPEVTPHAADGAARLLKEGHCSYDACNVRQAISIYRLASHHAAAYGQIR